jgi:hypothetical protein
MHCILLQPTDNVESQRLTPELQQMGIKGYLPVRA